MAKFRLNMPYYDNVQFHKKGAELDFEWGKQPKNSTPLEEEPEIEGDAEKPAAKAVVAKAK